MDSTTQIQFIRIAQADHEIITRIMENSHRLFAGERPPNAPELYSNLQQLLTVKILEHFAFEEKHVFPQLLAGKTDSRVVNLVAELLLEHPAMVTVVQQLGAQIYQRDLTDCTDEIWEGIMEFLSDMHTHATKENRLYQLVLETAATSVAEISAQARWMRDGGAPLLN